MKPSFPKLPRVHIASIVLLGGLCLTGLTAHFSYETVRISSQYRFQEVTEEIRNGIHSRIQIYLNAIVQTRGLFQLNPALDRADFKTYTDNMNMPVEYPGTMGLGFIAKVAFPEKPDFESRIRREYDNPALKVWGVPATRTSALDTSYLVRAFEPEMASIDGKNVIGYAVETDPVLAQTLEHAMESGEPALTPPIQLVMDPSSQPGFILLAPVYASEEPAATVSQRRSALIGFVFSAFRAHDLFSGLFGREWLAKRNVQFQIVDGSFHETSGLSTEKSIYGHAAGTPGAAKLNSHSTTFPIVIGNRPMTVVVRSTGSLIHPSQNLWPALLLVIGTLISLSGFKMIRKNQHQSEQLYKSERQLRLVTDAIPALVSYVDSERRFRFHNRAYEDWFRLHEGEAAGHHLTDVIGKRNYLTLRPYLDRAFFGQPVHAEDTIQMESGRMIPVSMNFIPEFSRRGSVRGVITLINDISERKRNEEKSLFLAELGSVLGSSLEVDGTLSRLGPLLTPALADWCLIDLFIDGRLQRVTAVSADPQTVEFIDQVKSRFPFQTDGTNGAAKAFRKGQVIVETDRNAMSSLNPQEFARNKCEIVDLLGGHSAIYAPLMARDRVLGVMTLVMSKADRAFDDKALDFIMDIARRSALALDNAQLYRESNQINRAKDEFLATLSHELRTPMNVILGWLELINEGQLDEDSFQQALSTLNRNARVQLQLINDLLDISRIISGKLALNLQTLDLGSVVKNTVEGFTLAAKAKGIEITTRIDCEGSRLKGDPDRLNQVLWNLISNALKFTPQNGRIDVSLNRTDKALEIQVTDSGQGIDPDFLPYIFDRFRQEDGSSTRSQGGLGLGLSIVRYLIELHGGTISAHSEGRNMGATFTIRLPAESEVRVAVRETRTDPIKPSSQARDLDGLRILLLDDSSDVRILISRILTKAGAHVLCSDTTIEAGRIIKETIGTEQPNLLLCDLGLPDEDGLSFIRRIRQHEARMGQTPLKAIALTGYALESTVEEALAAGFDGYITKPVSSAKLVETIRSLAYAGKAADAAPLKENTPG
jgi:PAS domain S-box-containing protein